METVDFTPPIWILAGEYVIGDTTSGGSVINEGVANRPAREVYGMFDQTYRIVIGSRITVLNTIDSTDPICQGTSSNTLSISNAYIVNLGGAIVLHLPIAPVTGDVIFVRAGTGSLNVTDTLTIIGKSDQGFPIGSSNEVVIPANTYEFCFRFIFLNTEWYMIDITGGSEETLPDAQDIQGYNWLTLQQDVKTKLTLDALAEWLSTPGGGLPYASETVAGIIKLATQTLVIAGVDDLTAITPLKLRTELPRFLETWLNYLSTVPDGNIPYTDRANLDNDTGFVDWDYLVIDAPFIENDEDLAQHVTAVSYTVWDIRDGFKYTYDTTSQTWIKGSDVLFDNFAVGRLYSNTVTARLFYIRNSTTVEVLADNANTDNIIPDLDNRYVPLTRTVNTHQLSTDIVLSAADVGAYTTAQTDAAIQSALNFQGADADAQPGYQRIINGQIQVWTGAAWAVIFPAQYS